MYDAFQFCIIAKCRYNVVKYSLRDRLWKTKVDKLSIEVYSLSCKQFKFVPSIFAII